MRFMNTTASAPTDRWSMKQVVLHWSTSVLIFMMILMGFNMTAIDPATPERLFVSRMHSGIGMTILALTIARLIVKLRGKSPSPLPLPALHLRGISIIHGALYVVIFAILASGLASAVSTHWGEYLGGEQPLPPDFKGVVPREAHELFVFALMGLIALHVGGVVVQEFRGGGALRRMLPFLK